MRVGDFHYVADQIYFNSYYALHPVGIHIQDLTRCLLHEKDPKQAAIDEEVYDYDKELNYDSPSPLPHGNHDEVEKEPLPTAPDMQVFNFTDEPSLPHGNSDEVEKELVRIIIVYFFGFCVDSFF
ncbi:MAG: hypothetical protein H0V43_00440 [Gemmatimonadales bacterium]|nr:hypothetical protein [Gemmatimonadales bacterium]